MLGCVTGCGAEAGPDPPSWWNWEQAPCCLEEGQREPRAQHCLRDCCQEVCRTICISGLQWQPAMSDLPMSNSHFERIIHHVRSETFH